jgi:phosphate-selective porin OprO/OprP
MQYDNVFFSQSQLLRAVPGARAGPAQGVASGPALGGIGDLQDGTFFRRVRAFAEGVAWEQTEYRLIVALENDQFSSIGFDEFWVGLRDVPFIGTVRVGHIKNQFGIEGDTTASSRAMTFMERSASSESIYQNQNFVTGLLVTNNFCDQRVSWEGTVFRQDQGASSGVFFGDGQYGMQGRLTGLPVDEDDGRHLMHLAVSGGWRNGQNNITNSPFRTTQLRARDELRADDPAASPANAQVIPNANSSRLIDTGAIVERDEWLMGTELLYIRGPFSVQAEYGFHWVDGARGIAPTGLKLNPAIVPSQDYMFSGGYIQLAYTLTGENRSYDRRLGTLAREYYGPNGPYSKAWLVRDENGNCNWGIGAWELAARYTYVNLNDGSGSSRIQGGMLNGVTIALNWYLNTNVNVMFDWVYDRRSDVPNGTVPGYVSGFGTEIQFQF